MLLGCRENFILLFTRFKKKKKNCLFGANPNTYHLIMVFIAPAVFIFKVLHKYIGCVDYSNIVVQKVTVYPFYSILLYI